MLLLLKFYLTISHHWIMKIIPATVEHLNELAKLFDAYRIFYRKSSDVASAARFLSERLERKDSVIYLAIDNNDAIAGFTQLYPLFSSTRLKRLWLLNDLFVKEDSRGKGYSKLLIERAKALAIESEAAGLSLETEMSNHIGNALYPDVGFELDTEHNFYFWENKIR